MTREELLAALTVERFGTTVPEYRNTRQDLVALVDAVCPLEVVEGDVA